MRSLLKSTIRCIFLLSLLPSVISCDFRQSLSKSQIFESRSIQLLLDEKITLVINDKFKNSDIEIFSGDTNIISITDDLHIIPQNVGTTTVIANTGNTWDEIPVEVTDKYIIAGVLRRVAPSPWYMINDGGHSPIGIKAVTEDEEKITIEYTFTSTKINSFCVTVDETFAKEGYLVGASVGNHFARIYLSKIENGNVMPIDPSTVSNSLGNLWIYGIFTIEKQES